MRKVTVYRINDWTWKIDFEGQTLYLSEPQVLELKAFEDCEVEEVDAREYKPKYGFVDPVKRNNLMKKWRVQ